jgi:hypothetical protein
MYPSVNEMSRSFFISLRRLPSSSKNNDFIVAIQASETFKVLRQGLESVRASGLNKASFTFFISCVCWQNLSNDIKDDVINNDPP